MNAQIKALNMVRTAKVLSFDTETTGLQQHDEVCGYVFYNGTDGIYIPVRHGAGGNIDDPKDFETRLNEAFAARTGVTVGHHLAFDIKMCKRHGITLNKNLSDTQINEGLVDDHTRGYSLQACSERHNVTVKKGEDMYAYLAEKFGGEANNKQMGRFWELPGDDPVAVDYAVGDGISTYELLEAQVKLMREQDLLKVYTLECELIWYLGEMYERGMKVDMLAVPQIRKDIAAQVEAAEKELPKGFNPRSGAQVEKLMTETENFGWPVTEKGNPSFREKWLETNEVGRHILTLRRLKKLEESFITPLVETYNVDGRVHAMLNQSKSDEYGTVTGRLSCSNPNLQAFPKRNRAIGQIVRQLIIPDEGYILYEDDYQQQEPRLFAHYSGDDNLMKGYLAEPFIDVHTNTSKLLTMPRSYAKRLSMGMLTGLGRKALAGHMDVSQTEGNRLHTMFFQAYPKVKEFQDIATMVAEERGFVKTALGRRGRFPLNERGRRENCYRATSRIIQGTGADHTKQGLLNACKFAEKSNDTIQILMTIHDSFIYQATPGADIDGLRREIEKSAQQLKLKVPIPLEHGSGKNWSEASYG